MRLSDPVATLPLVGNKYSGKLEKLGIFKIEDLLLHVPSRYIDFRLTSKIANTQMGETLTIKAEITETKNLYSIFNKKVQIAQISDETGDMQVVFFNQPFLYRIIKKGQHFSFSGKVGNFKNKKAFISPFYENIDNGDFNIHTGRLVPIYPETFGISSKWLRTKVFFTWQNLRSNLKDFLETSDRERLKLEELRRSFESVHFPKEIFEIENAKKRLAFDELLFHQLKSLIRKNEWSKLKSSLKVEINEKIKKEFISSLPFTLTNSQLRSIEEVYADLKKTTPMNRLLEGDVGSGKTVVAAAACFASFVNGYQSIIMAPTQILATQHFESLQNIFSKLKLRISLVTSAGVKADTGKSDIFVGTHALIHKKVSFDKVSVVVIDEQHRFGVEQRAHLIKKSTSGNKVPNVLTMTATPIPRTIALTLYGDLDLSVLDELPKGRIPITTWIVPQQKREGAYGWIKEQIKKDKVQAFVICPLIEESQVESMKQIKAATQEFEDLKIIFKGLKLGLLHGRQKSKEKDEILDKFRKGKIDILVSTPVVEVGIDVPNATIMLIEAGERYGLAQLHQLRGRIGRGSIKSYCLVFTSSRSRIARERLYALTKNLSGFELSELDLKIRGPGELMGTRQHGFPELKIASWGDTELIKKSRDFAEIVIDNPKIYSGIINTLNAEKIVPN